MVQNLATGAGGTRRGRTPDEFVAHHEPAGAGNQWPQVLCVRRCLNRSHQRGREMETANTRPCATRRIREDGGGHRSVFVRAAAGEGKKRACPKKKADGWGPLRAPSLGRADKNLKTFSKWSL